jgi:hypothetical protein
MSNFRLVHLIPGRTTHLLWHGLIGCKEVIETIYWGLEQLGHQVSYAVNHFSLSSINIVFGVQNILFKDLEKFPDDTIIYNLEQLRGLTLDQTVDQLKPHFKYCATRFKIWDYSMANLETWRCLNATNVYIVPVGYAPILSRITKAQHQDLDVLLYGTAGRNRLDVFQELSLSGLTVMFVSGLYGTARDNLIARSKLVLNINLYERAKIFEIVRVSYLLANRKAVIAGEDPDTYVEEDIRGGIKFSPLKEIVANCYSLIEDDSKRTAIEDAGFEAMTKRDIRKILEVPLRQ